MPCMTGLANKPRTLTCEIDEEVSWETACNGSLLTVFQSEMAYDTIMPPKEAVTVRKRHSTTS
jgi:hypothetical protein